MIRSGAVPVLLITSMRWTLLWPTLTLPKLKLVTLVRMPGVADEVQVADCRLLPCTASNWLASS